MAHLTNKIMGEFKDIDKATLHNAIIDFLDNLTISGSIVGEYDLYDAIHGEQEKAKKNYISFQARYERHAELPQNKNKKHYAERQDKSI